jgi:type II secretory pathway component PulF
VKRFQFLAARPDGSLVRGTLHAREEADVDRRLASQGLSPVQVNANPGAMGNGRKPHRRHLTLLLRSVASLCDSGMPVLQAVAATQDLQLPSSLKSIVGEVHRLVREGESLADALEIVDILPPAVIGTLRAGERGGQLQVALERSAAQLEYEADAIARLKRTLTYPLVLSIGGLISVFTIVFLVLPRFVSMLEGSGQHLPLLTRAVIAASGVVRDGWPFLLGSAALLLTVLRRWAQVPANQAVLHRAVMHTPVIGRVRLAWATAYTARSLGTMLDGGVPLLRALEIACASTPDQWLKERLERVTARVANGGRLSVSLSAEGVFLPGSIVLIGLGESSGRLSDMLLRSGDAARIEAERSLDLALTLLEPGVILFFGGMIAVVAAAMFQAVYSLRPGT